MMHLHRKIREVLHVGAHSCLDRQIKQLWATYRILKDLNIQKSGISTVLWNTAPLRNGCRDFGGFGL